MYKDKILKLLRSAKDGFASGQELASRLGISRTMVWKHIKALEHAGYGIEAVPSRGYRITSVPDLLVAEDIRRGLGTEIIGKQIFLLEQTSSTNTIAMEMASQGAGEGTVVIAETQSGGRGRLGRKWISPKGNVYLSVVLRPAIPTHKAPLITLTGAVAVARAIRSVCGLPAAIKWPNDVLVSGRKVSGLLTEMSAEPDRIKHVVLGIGVNANMESVQLPADLRRTATTLALEAGRNIDRTGLVRCMLRELEARYRSFLKRDGDILKEWQSLNVTIGSPVEITGPDTSFRGLAQGIDGEGRLIVRLEDGALRTVAAGDVTILKK